MSDKLNEMDLDKPDTMNNLKVNNISAEKMRSHTNLRISLSGSGMDFFISSEYDGGLSCSEENNIFEKFEPEVQEIIDAYKDILHAKMLQIDKALVEAEKKKKNGSGSEKGA